MHKSGLLFLLVSAFTSTYSQSLVSTARWATQKVKIDGIADEWADPLNFYDIKTHLLFGIANDSSTLYLVFQNPDEGAQSKIFRCGMNVTISVKKMKRKVTLTYPLPQSGEDDAGPDHTPNMEIMKSNFRMQSIMMVAEGFSMHNGMLPVTDSSVIKPAISWNENNNMIYELAIPFTEIYGSNFSTSDLANELMLYVEIAAMEKPHVSGSSQAPIGAAGAVGARAMSGMNYQTVDVGKGPWYETQEFKQKFVLAKKP
ncbi:MAG: hypothetical protein AB7G44_15585 [Bacteroidia bacterium]